MLPKYLQNPADGDKDELRRLRVERAEIIAAYGNMAQYHPMNVHIGGLNPAAMRLYHVRRHIAHLEAKAHGPRANVRLKDGRNPRGTGLLYDVSFDNRHGMIGRTLGGVSDFYVIENGEIASSGHRTLGIAVKAFEKG